MADALSNGQLAKWLPGALFGENGPDIYFPGPISRQVAYLKTVFERELDIVTTNYDDLLEVALRDYQTTVPVVTYTGGLLPPGSHHRVTHPHGYLGRDRWSGELIVTEDHYHALQSANAWQHTYVGSRLRERQCLFLGLSLTDPNLTRWLYDYPGSHRHAAVFVHQAETPGLPPRVRAARERATIERCATRNVDAVFVPHFADVAQLVNEIAYRRAGTEAYRSVVDRARQWISAVQAEVVGFDNERRFRARQHALNAMLRGALEDGFAALESLGFGTESGTLVLSLWLCNASGDGLYMWATTDRLHFDPRTVLPEPFDADSKWVAVKTMCHGRPIGEPLDLYASRWKYIRGLPLDFETRTTGWLPVGCLTLASMLPSDETILNNMPGGIQAKFHQTILESVHAYLRENLEAIDRRAP